MSKLRKPSLPRAAKGQPAQPKPPKLDALAQINHHAAGLDIGDAEIYAAVPESASDPAVRVFRTFTPDLEALADWLTACHVDTVAMESTGVYWIPIYELLEPAVFRSTWSTPASSRMSRARRPTSSIASGSNSSIPTACCNPPSGHRKKSAPCAVGAAAWAADSELQRRDSAHAEGAYSR